MKKENVVAIEKRFDLSKRLLSICWKDALTAEFKIEKSMKLYADTFGQKRAESNRPFFTEHINNYSAYCISLISGNKVVHRNSANEYRNNLLDVDFLTYDCDMDSGEEWGNCNYHAEKLIDSYRE